MTGPMDVGKVLMVRSAKGYDMLCVDNYLYHYEDRGICTYRWVCNRRKDKLLPCRSRIITRLVDGDETRHAVKTVCGDHTHERCLPKEIARAQERKRLANLDGKPCTLVNKTENRKIRRIRAYECGSRKRPARKTADCDSDTVYSSDGGAATAREQQQPTRKLKGHSDSFHEYNFEKDKLYMLKTSLGRQMLCLNGHIYRQDAKSQTTSTYRWECIRRRDTDCSTRIFTECMANECHKLKTPARKVKHTHDPYTSMKLTKLLYKNNINCITEHEQDDNDDDSVGVEEQEEMEMENTAPSASVNTDSCQDDEPINGADAAASDRRTGPHQVQPLAVGKRRIRASTKQCVYELAEDPLAALQEGEVAKSSKTKKFTFLPSAKGNKVLVLNNYIFHFDSQSQRNGRSFWTCTLRRDKTFKCRARVTTAMTKAGASIVGVSGEHSHPDCREDIRRRLYKSVVASKVRKTKMKPSEIIQSSMSELDENFKEIVAHSKESIERRIGRLRMKMQRDIEREYEKVRMLGFYNADDISDAESSSSSVISSLDSADDHLDFSNLPSRLEEMRAEESPAAHPGTAADGATAPATEAVYVTNTETVWDPNVLLGELLMEEEYLDAAFAECDSSMEVDTLSHLDDIRVETKIEPLKKIATELDMDITKVSKLRSAKGGELLCVDGYIYHLKSMQNIRTYWTCIKCKDRVLKCKSRVATILTTDGKLKVSQVTNRHTHPVNEVDIKRRLYNSLVRDNAAVKAHISPRQVLQKSLHELSEEYAELLENSLGAEKRRSQQRKPPVKLYRERHMAVDEDEDDTEQGLFGSTMKLYAVSDGPPSLAVRMTLKALGVPFELVNVDYGAAEHMTEEYAKLNPQKEIPVLDDDGFYLSESIAIMQYLCEKYGADSQYYPKDPTQRAVVNHRLCFNMGFYYASISAHSMAPIFFDYQRTDMTLKKANNALSVFETYLKRAGTKYAAGDQVTIADFALVSSTLCMEAINFDLSPYPLVKKWYAMFKQENPQFWDIAKDGLQELIEFEKNPPDLSNMNHPFHPTRKVKQ